ncbi:MULTISPECIES: hypothetical protein [unclassified Streptomyces]|uniref:hypothetical protein n=1 Tax=unclassified Streptomyces TaxID=2593676 RepID=UPI003D74D5BD
MTPVSQPALPLPNPDHDDRRPAVPGDDRPSGTWGGGDPEMSLMSAGNMARGTR